MRALPVLVLLLLSACGFACSRTPMPVLADPSYPSGAENRPLRSAGSASADVVAPPPSRAPLAASPAAKVAERIVPSATQTLLAPLLLVDRASKMSLCRIQLQEEGGLGLQVMAISADGQSHQNLEVCDPNECRGQRAASLERLESGLAQLGVAEVDEVPVSRWPSKQTEVELPGLDARLSVKAGKVTLVRKGQRPTVLGAIEATKTSKVRLTAFAYSPSNKLLVIWAAQDPDATYHDGSGLPDEVYAWAVP